MSKTVTTAFSRVWGRKNKIGIQQIQYKRRYWNGSAYAYEGSWTTLSQSEYAKVGTIAWSLDSENLNEFRVSNVSIYLNNNIGDWMSGNTSGKFGEDATATSGYEPYLMQFRIQFGYYLPDGTTEILVLFTGLSIDFIFRSQDNSVEIVLIGNEQKLMAADAQNVSTAFTQQATSPATGDGSNKTFVTTATGVAKVSQVRVATIAQTEGTNYSITNLDDPSAGATITFVSAPTAGQAVDATGTAWKANNTIDVLVGLLCDEAGIASADRTINAVIFPGGLSGSKTIDSEAQWEAGTVLTNIDSNSTSGHITTKWVTIDDFDDGDYTANPAWTISGSASITGGALVLSGVTTATVIFSLDSTNNRLIGTWRWRQNITTLNGDIAVKFYEKTGTFGSANYKIVFFPTGVTQLIKTGYFGETVLANLTNWSTGYKEYRVTVESSGLITVYLNGVADGNYTDTTGYMTSWPYVNRFILSSTAAGNSVAFDDLYYSGEIDGTGAISTGNSSTYESEEFDLLAAPIAWGLLDRTHTLYDGTIAYSTNVASVSGGPYDGYTAIAADGTIQSALKRYLKIKATLSMTEGSSNPAHIDKLVAHFTVSTVNLKLGIFRGQTCYTAVQKLASLADYEWGFDADGKFFFRSKTISGSPAVEIDQESGISEIRQMRLGYDRVINMGQVQYGNYYKEYGSSDAAESNPTSQQRFGKIIRNENWDEFLLANDVDIATAKSRLIHDNNYLPKKRFSLTSKMIPHLNLSDMIRINFFERPAEKENIYGDPISDFSWGFIRSFFGAAEHVLAYNLDCKVIGIIYDLEKCICELELEEVL